MAFSLKENHYFLDAASNIDEICSPLKNFGILHFTYMKNYLDGNQIYLSNHAKWIKDYYDHKLYLSSAFVSPPNQYVSGFSVWPSASDDKVLAHGRMYFDSDHGITYIQKHDCVTEFLFFSGSTSNFRLINFYLNNLDLLELFYKYFKEKSFDILKRAEKNKLIVPGYYSASQNNFNLLPNESTDNFNKKMEVISLLQSNIYHNKNAKLTKREADCVICLLKGKTAKQTARELKISPRTVETYLENVKSKYNCKSKIELISLLSSKYSP